MQANFCFDFVIAVHDHDSNVEKYRHLLGIEPIELAAEKLPSPAMRCTIFPLWNLDDRGMVLSIVSSTVSDDYIGAHLARNGEGIVYFGIDVDDIDALRRQGEAAGVRFQTDEPIAYDIGSMLNVVPATTNNIPFFFSEHTPGWWQKSLAGLQDH